MIRRHGTGQGPDDILDPGAAPTAHRRRVIALCRQTLFLALLGVAAPLVAVVARARLGESWVPDLVVLTAAALAFGTVVAAVLTIGRARALTPWRSPPLPTGLIVCALGWDETIDPPALRSPKKTRPKKTRR